MGSSRVLGRVPAYSFPSSRRAAGRGASGSEVSASSSSDPDRIKTTADDMPGGTELRLQERGFSFRQYVLKVPVGKLRLRMRCHDCCWLDDADVPHDEIDMRFMRLPSAGSRCG